MSRVRHQYQAARWDEPLIYELGSPGERSVFPPSAESGIREVAGDPLANLPKDLRRSVPVDLPEISEPQVLRHYTRLSQMCLGVDVAVDMTGTCTMKYSPKINELLTPELVAELPSSLQKMAREFLSNNQSKNISCSWTLDRSCKGLPKCQSAVWMILYEFLGLIMGK